MVSSGVMATSATTPKASVARFPPAAVHSPIVIGSRKAAVIGPEATPPESKAIAVNSFGHRKQERVTYDPFAELANDAVIEL